MADVLQRFLNDARQVEQWPATRSNQTLVLQYLSSKFEYDVIYTEAVVNAILQTWHTYQDWPTLRRALVDNGYLTRKYDGTEYRRIKLVN